ncbi:hypothetical protein KBB12_00745 [Candidatus Woesebacteria bacterium]|nr:hypothetical protein [Candidatus Woesebacteria bacterium]
MRLLAIISNIIVWVLVAGLLLTAPPEIPLYFSRVWGESQIASKWAVLLLPFLMNVTFIVSNWFTKQKFSEDEEFGKITRTILIVQVVVIIGILIRTLWTVSS